MTYGQFYKIYLTKEEKIWLAEIGDELTVLNIKLNDLKLNNIQFKTKINDVITSINSILDGDVIQ